MMDWKTARNAYIIDHQKKNLVQKERRLNALKKIEEIFREKYSEVLLDEDIFNGIKKSYLLKLYELLKGVPLSAAEKSVFNGLYKFSK